MFRKQFKNSCELNIIIIIFNVSIFCEMFIREINILLFKRYNNVGEEGCKYLGDSLTTLSKLKSLNL